MRITASEAMDNGVWLKLCDLKGINEWAVNEGLMDGSDEIELTIEAAKELGILGGS